METRGRKPIIFPQSEIENIIYRFSQEEKVTGLIKYSDIYRFAKKLYEKEEIQFKLSEDFWRRNGRQGKETIDKINKLYETTITNNRKNEIEIFVDTEDCVNKFFSGKPSEKKKLVQALKINEKKAKDSNRLLDKIEELKHDLSTQQNKNKQLQTLIDQYQSVLFSWFNASVKSDVPLVNLISTGKTRHPIVNYFFETIFSTPNEGYTKFEEYRKGLKNCEDSAFMSETTTNVVTPISKTRLQEISEKFNLNE